MDAAISRLLEQFERGTLTRRDLIRHLAILTAAGSTAPGFAAQANALKGAKIDHVSIQVSDLPRSIAFYQTIFGLSVLSEDKPNEIVRLGAEIDQRVDHRLTDALDVVEIAVGLAVFAAPRRGHSGGAECRERAQ